MAERPTGKGVFPPVQVRLPGFEVVPAVVAESEAQRRRAELYRLRDAVRPLNRARARFCGWVRHSENVEVGIRGETARFAGLVTCGSPWECPCCMGKIKHQRAAEVDAAVEAHGKKRVIMLTLTLRHGYADKLGELRRALAEAWRVFCGGKGWRTLQERAGLRGWIRALEVTHGRAGWHPHLHILLFSSFDSKHEIWNELKADFADRWAQSCARLARPAYRRDGSRRRPALLQERHLPTLKHGAYLAPATGRYLSKLGLELNDWGQKIGRKGRRTPLQIATDIAAAPTFEPDRKLWTDYRRAMLGARFLTWSRHLRESLALPDEVSDEAAATEDAGHHLLTVEGADWDRLRHQRGFAARLLSACERGKGPGCLSAALALAGPRVERPKRLEAPRQQPAPAPTAELLLRHTRPRSIAEQQRDRDWEWMHAEHLRDATLRLRAELGPDLLTPRRVPLRVVPRPNARDDYERAREASGMPSLRPGEHMLNHRC